MEITRANTDMHILLGFDGSNHSFAAISLIKDLCENIKDASKVEVSLLAAFTPRQIDERTALERALTAAQNSLSASCFQVATHLVLGYPAEKIVEFSQQEQPHLIVVGAKGLRSTLGILLGGVAQQVVEYACCPVLVVRAPYKPIQHVLLVIDGSESSSRAAEYLKNFPLVSGELCTIMHVLPPLPIRLPPELIAQSWPLGPEIVTPPVEPPSARELAWREEEQKQGEKLLAEQLESFAGLSPNINTVLRRGDAATEILDFAKENAVDLIVSGSRGLSTIRSWLLGSVSRKLVHYASCSTLIVKGPAKDSNLAN